MWLLSGRCWARSLVDQLTVLDVNDYVKHPNETLTGKG